MVSLIIHLARLLLFILTPCFISPSWRAFGEIGLGLSILLFYLATLASFWRDNYLLILYFVAGPEPILINNPLSNQSFR